MDKASAQGIVSKTFKASFDRKRFRDFVNELCNGFDEGKAVRWSHQYVKNAYKEQVSHFERIASYLAPDNQTLDVMVVHLKCDSSLERSRSVLRNFAADYLANRGGKDAALIAFVSTIKLLDTEFPRKYGSNRLEAITRAKIPVDPTPKGYTRIVIP